MKWIIALSMAGTLALAGCGKDDKSEGQAAAAAEIGDQDLPVETDFEQEAEQQITGDNYSQELEALEKEIATE